MKGRPFTGMISYMSSKPWCRAVTVLGVPSPPMTTEPTVISSTLQTEPSPMRIPWPFAWHPVESTAHGFPSFVARYLSIACRSSF